MRLGKTRAELKVNPSLTLVGISGRAVECLLGNRSALEWVIDQYQVKAQAQRHSLRPEPPGSSKSLPREFS
jgi:predicted helicase